MISRKGLPDFMKKMSDERLAELADPKNFRQTPVNFNDVPWRVDIRLIRKQIKEKKGKK